MAIVSPMVSLFTAAAVLTAFRLPALMMFRGINIPSPFRRPVMVVRMPSARSMPALPQPSSSNMSALPSHPLPSYQMPFPPPFPMPPIPAQYRPPPGVTSRYIPLHTTRQPFYNQIFKKQPTSRKPDHKNGAFNYNKHQKHSSDHISKYLSMRSKTRRPTTDADDHKYAIMYPMPRNYDNNSPEEWFSQTTPLPLASPLPNTRTETNKPSIDWLTDENELNIDPINTKTSIRTTFSPNNRGMKAKLRYTRIRPKRITTTIRTTTERPVYTPAPIENYIPVKATIDRRNDESEQKLMFDNTKNLYYYEKITRSS